MTPSPTTTRDSSTGSDRTRHSGTSTPQGPLERSEFAGFREVVQSEGTQ